MLQRGLIDKAVEGLCQGTDPLRGTTGARAIHHTLGALLGQALPPCAQGGMGKVQGRGDAVDVLASNDLTHGLRATKDAGLLGRREQPC
jgi:hypothetical protein